MFYSSDEIELTLYLYPIAKLHMKEISIDKQMEINYNKHVEKEYYYIHIICVVENWLMKLSNDEKEIINLRIYQKLSYENIACKLGYTNHSSVLRKYKNIISKISSL